MKKKLKMYRRLETLKKKDINKDQYQSNLISKEIKKTASLIEKIEMIINENSNFKDGKFLSAAEFKNNSNLLSTLASQKNVAINKNEFLVEQKSQFDLRIAKNNKDKKRVSEKYDDVLKLYKEDLEKKNHIVFKNK
tara:strand:- start:2 stop:409 length:408 start_codon:yes stop_codon:yes gene_type:complete